MTTKLITIPFSHYCEKARWALDRAGVTYVEDGHLPVFHYLATYRAGGKRTVPVLVDGTTVVRDSTDIIAWADARRPGCLIPFGSAEDVLAIEDDLDDHFGPHTRRWGYFHLLPVPEAIQHVAAGVPRWERAILKVSRPLAIAYLERSMKIDEAGVERSRQKIDATFDRIEKVIRDGRRYIAGDRFTVADLTFAALAAPILLPPNHPVQTFELSLFGPTARDQIEKWRERPAGRFAIRLYQDDRVSLSRAA
jgi:glutathione S-transferase